MSLIEWKISTIENIRRRRRQRRVYVIRNAMHPRYNEKIASAALHTNAFDHFSRTKIIDRPIHSSTLFFERKRINF